MHDQNADGSWSAWGEDWTIDITIVEAQGALQAAQILGKLEAPATQIAGSGWIGSREILREADGDRTVFRLATKLCADNTFMSCWVSYFSEDQLAFADSIIRGIKHDVAKPKPWWKKW